MSNITDLQSNNLSTTEDAFEKFQAVSMYEEDEFITLSDIESPLESEYDISKVLNEVPGDEVSGQEARQNINHSPVPQETQVQEEILESNATVDLNIKSNASKRKGRKRRYGLGKKINQYKNKGKKSINNKTTSSLKSKSDLNYDMIIGEENSQLKPSQKISKPSIECKSDEMIEENNAPPKKILSKRGRPIKLKKNMNVPSATLADDENKKDNKKRKKLSDISINSEPLTSYEKNLVPGRNSNDDELVLNKNKTLKNISKGEEPLKVEHSSNNTELEDDLHNDEDIPLVALSSKNSTIDCALNKKEISKDTREKLNNSDIAYPVDSSVLTEKIPKKRGRPKKKISDNALQTEVNLNERECEKKVATIETVSDERLCTLSSEIEKSDISSYEIREHLVIKDSNITQDLIENSPNESPNKRRLKKPTMSDFEYNIDSIVKHSNNAEKSQSEHSDNAESLLNESSRPVRRKAKKNLDYDEGSDEDPFANIELSDDDLPRRKKGSRYFSDDEYIPGDKRRQRDLSDSDIDEEDFEKISKQKKKKGKRLDLGLCNKSPTKRSRKPNGEKLNNYVGTSVSKFLIDETIDTIEESSQNIVIEEEEKTSWDGKNEFQNFLAKIAKGTDIKIKKAEANDIEKTALQIPVLESTTVMKNVEMSTQTNVTTKHVAVQTNSLYDITMKKQIALTADQSEKACDFLSGIVKTTSELGQLMTQKSEDFIEKKINTKNVTDTFKMDYCVKKSFLLLKLAKHNLVQMEEDLSKHYEEFLKTNDLLKYREEKKVIASTSKSQSDSDCEIVEVPLVKKVEKPAFNPKTVFLNKELSIKIAKKTVEKPKPKEKLNIKGRHTVWINDSIMVKKVKLNQSFLAQDSRNKKPPDTFVTMQMVSNFFKTYERQKALQICAPYVKYQGLYNKTYICYYFADKSTNFHDNSQTPYNEPIEVPVAESERSTVNENNLTTDSNKMCPESLCSICTQIIQKRIYREYPIRNSKHIQNLTYVSGCKNSDENIQAQNIKLTTVSSLKTLCYKTIMKLIYTPYFSDSEDRTVIFKSEKQKSIFEKNNNILSEVKIEDFCNEKIKVLPLFSLCVDLIKNCLRNEKKCEYISMLHQPHTLKEIVFKRFKSIFYKNTIQNSIQENSSKARHEIKTLSKMCIDLIMTIINNESIIDVSDVNVRNQNNNSKNNVMSLNFLCFNKVKTLLNQDQEYGNVRADAEEPLNFYIANVNTVSEDVFLEENNYQSYFEDDPYIDNEEHNFSDNDDINNYDFESREDDNNWVKQVQVQELRSCADSIIEQKFEKNQEPDIADCLMNIKVEPLEDIPESIAESSTIKTEYVDVDETPLTHLDIITKQENVISYSSNKEVIHSQSSNSYDVDTFEAFVSSNKMILSMLYSTENENNKVSTQGSTQVRRQFEPDSYDDIESCTDTLNLLVPKNVNTAKGKLMESSSDESSRKKNERKKLEKRKTKPKKKKESTQPSNEKLAPRNDNDIAILTRKMKDKIRQEEKNNHSSDSELEDMSLNLRKDKARTVNENKEIKSPNIDSSEKVIQCNDVDSTEKSDDNIQIGISNSSIILNAEGTEGPVHANEPLSPSLNFDEPIELLECQPTIPSFDNDMNVNSDLDKKLSPQLKLNEDDTNQFINRHGWMCYPIDRNDGKIYQMPYVSIDKLPESFVETYFRYQNVIVKDKDDTEVDKLININSLHRTLYSQPKNKNSEKINKDKKEPAEDSMSQENLQAHVKIETHNELSPSEDEREDFEEDISHFAPKQSIDNCLAKDSLMDDNSDSEKLQCKELNAETTVKEEICPKTKSGRLLKSKEKKKLKPEDLMLTADKMMNKELALLNAPVEIKEETEDKKDLVIRSTRSSCRTATKIQTKKEPKEEDDSSSEEEKQWFTTKEKLLKKLIKKQEFHNKVDDAKRAKIVSEFIEKRGDGIESRKRMRQRQRSDRKLLERRKQMKILSRELFGDETSPVGKKSQSKTNNSTGRRNIRKVIDKKSLGRRTVVANMEEFERKKRLTQRQAQLRQVLGFEEGVNVVVINDELCLEYDFESQRPVVSVHPFFTKVMKAHQYEGVKFMWDACFESAAGGGAGGGGCILAHCMGLGKTLQVLALLHTVLTHPKVGIRRVLVCCPLSTVLNWVDEINKWIGPVTTKIKVFELSKLKKPYERAYQLEDWYNSGGIFIIGYELFRSLTTLDSILDTVRPTIIKKIRMALLDPGPDMIICDEGHLLKNDCSLLAVAMSRVVTKRRIILTGTPMQNNLREYYCMVNFVKPNLLGTYSEYSNRFENPIMNGQHRDSREEDIKLMKARTHILHKVLEGCLQRQEASVLYPYLPKKYEYTVFITLTKCQRDLYNQYLDSCSKQNKQSILKDFHVLQKIWTHPQVLHNFLKRERDDGVDAKIKVEKLEDDLTRDDLRATEDAKAGAADASWVQPVPDEQLHALDSSNKLLIVFRLLDECNALGDKVLIFSTSLYTLDSLEFFLRRERAWRLGHEYYRLDGFVPAEVRQKWCREFNAPHNTTTRLFLISTRAGSLGLNMTAANRVILLDTSWNPAHDIQSIFRVYRFGQKKDCYIYRLVAMGTMEQKIYERSVTKQAVACRVVDEQQIDRHYNMSELSELYKLEAAGAGVSAGLAAGVRDAALLRVARAGAAGAALHAVHEHDSLLRGDGESGLPEHERAAAWMQFQQEQADQHTTIQNFEIKLLAAKQTNNTKVQNDTRMQAEGEKCKIIPEGKPKREKRNSTISRYTDPQPSTSRQSESSLKPEAEESMIKKIMDILIKHNFHTTKSSQEISDLVIGVKSIIAKSNKDGLDNVNPLAKSIAKVLLESETLPMREPNNASPNTYKTESTDTIIGMANGDDISRAIGGHEKDATNQECYDRKRRRGRKQSDEEYVPARQKKKKVIPCEKSKKRKSNENNVTNENSLLKSLEEIQTEDYVLPKPQRVVNNPAEQKSTIEEPIKMETSKNNESEQTNVTDNSVAGESILLSDDDDDDDDKPLAAIKPPINVNKDNTKQNIEEENEEVEKKILPLHPSLLTNKNFIKILAHTYLSGNPMLDEDAAILAAQYSALKALREMKSTGKEITSGPIYEIAIKVLGKSLLTKLHKFHGLMNIFPNDKEKSNKQNEVSTEFPSGPELKTDAVLEATPKKTINNKQSVAHKQVLINNVQDCENENIDLGQIETGAATIPIASCSQNVVPVGIFKGPGSLHTDAPLSLEECILPHDDDIMITPENTKATYVTTAIDQKNFTRKNSRQLLVNAVIADSVNTAQITKDVPTEPKQLNLIITSSTEVTKSKTPVIAKISRAVEVTKLGVSPQVITQSDTICLPSRQLLVNSVIADSANAAQITKDIPTEPKQLNLLITPTEATKSKTPVIAKISRAVEVTKPGVSPQVITQSDAICLDSDEDEIITSDVSNVTQVQKELILPTTIPDDISIKKASATTLMDIPINKLTTSNKYITVPSVELETPKSKLTDTVDYKIINLNSCSRNTNKSVKSSSNSKGPMRNKTNSKSGDILRITESGKVEVLRRTEQVPASVIAFAMKDAQDTEISEVITDDCQITLQEASVKFTAETVTSVPKLIIKKSILKKPKEITKATKTTSILNSSLTKTPDPLPVLQDVVILQDVHIPANESIAQAKKDTVRNTFKPDVAVVNNVCIKPSRDKIISDARQQLIKLQNLKAKVSNKNVSTSASSASKLDVKNDKTIKKHNMTSGENKIDLTCDSEISDAPSTSKRNGNTKVIDLTENVPETNVTEQESAIKKRSFVPIPGISSHNMMNKIKELFKGPQDSPTKESTIVINNKTKTPARKNVTLKKVAMSDSLKRPAPRQESTVKKIKPDTAEPMTLKDFNLDDFDDIIELE